MVPVVSYLDADASLPQQALAVARLAFARGWTIVRSFHDTGPRRLEFSRLVDFAKQAWEGEQPIAHVLIESPERLGGDLAEQEFARHALASRGLEPVFADPAPDSAERVALRSLLARHAEFVKVFKGRVSIAALQRKYPVPTVFDTADGRFSLMLIQALHEHGRSIRYIADTLRDWHIPPMRGGHWRRFIVRDYLTRLRKTGTRPVPCEPTTGLFDDAVGGCPARPSNS